MWMVLLHFQIWHCLHAQGNTPSCEEGCLITLQSPDMCTHISPAPDSPPVVDDSHQEGIYTVSLPTAGSGESENSDDELDEAYVIQVRDWFGNESYFAAVCSYNNLCKVIEILPSLLYFRHHLLWTSLCWILLVLRYTSLMPL